MVRKLLCTLLISVTALTVGCPAAVAEPVDNTAAIGKYFDDFIAGGGTPGVLLEVSTAAGTWSMAKGLASSSPVVPMSAGLQHRIGSITKTFTTTLVLQLVGEDKIGLDDPIAKYVAGVPNGDEITIRMLGTMTSGLSEYLANPEFRAAVFADPHRVWSTQELLDASYALGQEFPPGASSSYSNTNTVLLGEVVEKVTGEPFRQVLDERLLLPNGLDHTIWPDGNQFSEDHTHGYTAWMPDRSITDSTYWNPSYGNAAGQMISTIDDLTKWVRLLGTGALLRPELQAERLEWQPIGDNNETWHYTFGIEENSGWLGHNGEIFGYESYAVYNPALDASIVLAVNTDKRIGAEPTINVLLRDISQKLFPGHRVQVPVVG